LAKIVGSCRSESFRYFRKSLPELPVLPLEDFRYLRSKVQAWRASRRLTWYPCTRHTFASHRVMNGRPIEKLQEIPGHSPVTVTEGSAHLGPKMFTRDDFAAIDVDLSEPVVLPLRASGNG